jgi:hypothetical protein
VRLAEGGRDDGLIQLHPDRVLAAPAKGELGLSVPVEEDAVLVDGNVGIVRVLERVELKGLIGASRGCSWRSRNDDCASPRSGCVNIGH